MTTTRPTVHFAEPRDSSFASEIENPQISNPYTYSSLTCEGCKSETQDWYGLAMMSTGIMILAIVGLLFARKYIFKIYETSRN